MEFSNPELNFLPGVRDNELVSSRASIERHSLPGVPGGTLFLAFDSMRCSSIDHLADSVIWDDATEKDTSSEDSDPKSENNKIFGDTFPFPGNGGTRVMNYACDEDASQESAALAVGMGTLESRTIFSILYIL